MLTEGDHDKMRGFAPEPTERMTDERLAEIEVCHVEVEPIDITDTWFYFEELPGYTTEIAHKQRGELLQALKAERAAFDELQDRVKNGFQGGCWCCESVATKNIELEAKLRAVVSDCAGCFRTAAEDIQDWGDYADAYFQKKHGLKSDVARYRNKADELEALLNEAPKS